MSIREYYDNDLSWEKSFNKESNFPVICIPELEFTLLLLQYLNMAAFKIKATQTQKYYDSAKKLRAAVWLAESSQQPRKRI